MTVHAIHKTINLNHLICKKIMAINFYFTWVGIITPFCSAHAMLASPQQTFGQLIEQQITGGFAQHPDFAKIDWSKVQYTLDGQTINPESTQNFSRAWFWA
jgi:phenol hydroxylase P4 protein